MEATARLMGRCRPWCANGGPTRYATRSLQDEIGGAGVQESVRDHEVRQHGAPPLNRNAEKECQWQKHQQPPRDEWDVEDQRQRHVLRGMPCDHDIERCPPIGPCLLQPWKHEPVAGRKLRKSDGDGERDQTDHGGPRWNRLHEHRERGVGVTKEHIRQDEVGDQRDGTREEQDAREQRQVVLRNAAAPTEHGTEWRTRGARR